MRDTITGFSHLVNGAATDDMRFNGRGVETITKVRNKCHCGWCTCTDTCLGRG